jgi:hypothetical protein
MVQSSAIQEEMMTTGTTLSRTAFLLLFVLGSLPAQELTARDVFWSSNDLIKINVTPNPAARPHTEKPGGEQPSLQRNNGQFVSQAGYGAAPQVVRTAKPRLGLRCALLLRGLDDRYIEVSSNSVFQSGDHIRLGLLANQPGYIYVIQQGSTGAWSPVFPPPGSPAATNKIRAGELQMFPDGTRAFAFDKTPGDEKLYVILSHAPIGDIDHAIRGLQGDHKIQPPPTRDNANDVQVATNNIPNTWIEQRASRDLTLVDEQTVNEPNGDTNTAETATYVVSKANAPDSSSEVVLRLDLRHQ